MMQMHKVPLTFLSDKISHAQCWHPRMEARVRALEKYLNGIITTVDNAGWVALNSKFEAHNDTKASL